MKNSNKLKYDKQKWPNKLAKANFNNWLVFKN